MTSNTLASVLASTLLAYRNCAKTPDTHGDWRDEHWRRLMQMADDLLPSGSGIDSGTKINTDKSTPERLVLTFGYHHMDEGGGYDGWTEHTCIIRASLVHGLDLRITGRNRNDIKDYLYDVYSDALSQVIAWNVASESYQLLPSIAITV